MDHANRPNLLSDIDLTATEATEAVEATKTKARPRRNRNDWDKYLQGRSYQLFKRGIKSPRTFEFYRRGLYFFCVHVGMSTEELVSKYCPYIKQDDGRHVPNIEGQMQLQRLVENFVLELHERVDRGEIEPTTVITRVPPVKLFFDMVDITLNWRKIGKLLPRADMAADDEAYTLEDINKMLQHCDLRARVIVLVLASSGIRLEALAALRDGDITPMPDKDDPSRVIAAHLKVYSYSPEDSYDTFISPEAYFAYAEYRKLRASYGEEITKKSPVITTRFSKSTFKKRKGVAKPVHPKITHNILRDLRKRAGLDVRSEKYNNRRFTIKTTHGLRKFFLSSLKSIKTTDGQFAIDFTSRERLMGHALVKERSLEQNYDRLDQIKLLLTEYLKAVPILTISDEARLALQVTKLEKDVSEYRTLDVELSEKDRKIREMEARMEAMQEDHNELKELLKHPEKILELMKEREC